MGRERQSSAVGIRTVEAEPLTVDLPSGSAPKVVVVSHLDGTTAILCGDLILVADQGSPEANARAAQAVLDVADASS